MPAEYQLTARAIDDLDGIAEFIAQKDAEAASRVIKALLVEIEQLAETPWLGSERRELLPPPHRFRRKWSYLIAYLPEPRPLTVVAVVHGARDLTKAF